MLLLERERELAALRALLADAASGSGHIAVINGPPGVGKTALAEALSAEAAERGFLALRARSSEFEREFAFGVARQLFEPVLRLATPSEREAILEGPASLAGKTLFGEARVRGVGNFDLFHSLYWLCLNVATRSPLVLVIDDAHWADGTTIGWIRYVARRREDLPALLLLTVRSDEAATATDLLNDLATAEPGSDIVLPALTPEATAGVLHAHLGSAPEPAFLEASHRATGGNPFLVTELARAMLAEGVKPRASEAWRIGSMRPQSIVRNIDARLRRLSGDAQGLAQAAAVFGMEAEFRHAATLAAMDVERATAAADELLTAAIIAGTNPIRFEHSLTRDAIVADLTPSRLARDHKRAADVLTTEAAPSDRIASHLLLTTPVADTGSARILRAAAEISLTAGAPHSAVVYLERALIEPPAQTDRPGILRLLASAKLQSGRSGAIEILQELLADTSDPTARVDVSRELAAALAALGRGRDAYETLGAALAQPEVIDRDLELSVEAEMMAVAQLDHRLIPVARRRAYALSDIEGHTPAERAVLAGIAALRASDGSPHEDVARLAHAALDPDGHVEDNQTTAWLIRTLSNLGEHELAERMLAAFAVKASQRGSVLAFAIAAMGRASESWMIGDIRAADDETRTATEAAVEAGWLAGVPIGSGLRVAVALELDQTESAMSVLGGLGLLGVLPEIGVLDQLLYFRGLLFAASGDETRALEDLLELGRRERLAESYFVTTQWRPAAALILRNRGEESDARKLLDEALDVERRRGSARGLAIALRAAGICESRIDYLEESSVLLSSTPFKLEEARSLVELGSAMRRGNRRSEARGILERGMDAAFRCGSIVVLERAKQELAAAGAKPRRLVLSGIDALTASERRVAELAADGRSNPQIAQMLFVTRKTVETHLSRVYVKLGIRSREDLARALSK